MIITQYEALGLMMDREWHTLTYRTANPRQRTSNKRENRKVRWRGFKDRLRIQVETEHGEVRTIWKHLIQEIDGKRVVFGE